MKKEKILGFDVVICEDKELIDNIFKDYQDNKQLFIVNINPEIIVTNYKNTRIKNIFNQQKYQIPDGSGIVWASKRQKGNIKKRITGIDMMLKLCEKSQEFKSKIYLYGGKKGVAEKAKNELKKIYSNINIVGFSNGYEEEKIVLDKIKKANPDILFVGLGAPQQEKFIIRNMNELINTKLFMPVGGSFDVISKNKKRAPQWIIKLNLEWLYRAFQEPRRVFRQFKLIKFMFLILKNKERKDSNE